MITAPTVRKLKDGIWVSLLCITFLNNKECEFVINDLCVIGEHTAFLKPSLIVAVAIMLECSVVT